MGRKMVLVAAQSLNELTHSLTEIVTQYQLTGGMGDIE